MSSSRIVLVCLAMLAAGIGSSDEPVSRVEIKKGLVAGYAKKEKPFVQRQATAKSLMVSFTHSGRMVGVTMDIIASATAASPADRKQWRFVRTGIGTEMKRACEEAVRLQRGRYPVWPGRECVSFSFGDKYSPKDGGSAGTAFALLLICLHDGIKLDAKTGITGDITVDWKVRKVGGIPAKIKGAETAGLKRVAIPAANTDDVYDLVLLSGPEQLWKIQVYTISTLDEAVETCRADRAAERLKAEQTFSSIQSYLQRHGEKGITKKVYGALQDIGKSTPNNLSARILWEYRNGKLKKRRLGLRTAVMVMAGYNLFMMPILDRKDYKLIARVPNSNLKDAKKMMKRIKPVIPEDVKMLHSRFYAFLQALRDYRYYITTNSNAQRKKTLEEITLPHLAERLSSELDKLSRNDDLLNRMAQGQ